ncbi:hypothetical protein PsorP6_006872 [Peronosclerospora sorghi]|uniref:Uncharacterized protein n=1 Tax=Peronosclerospora sorghi TaxID=230839 RepID=A0ACC0WB76_9STRA|nr:hypothetical protein PsorP6_006872 [Peronosclerospora sorghi]
MGTRWNSRSRSSGSDSAPTGATVMRASVSRSEFTALFASFKYTIPALFPFLALKQLQQLHLPCKLPYRGARWTITRISQRTFNLLNKLLNINAVTGSQSLIKQHKLRKRLGILLLPHQPQQVMRLKAFQILTSSRHASSDFASVKTPWISEWLGLELKPSHISWLGAEAEQHFMAPSRNQAEPTPIGSAPHSSQGEPSLFQQ